MPYAIIENSKIKKIISAPRLKKRLSDNMLWFDRLFAPVGFDIQGVNDDGTVKSRIELIDLGLDFLKENEVILNGEIIALQENQVLMNDEIYTLSEDEKYVDGEIVKLTEEEMQIRFPDRYNNSDSSGKENTEI